MRNALIPFILFGLSTPSLGQGFAPADGRAGFLTVLPVYGSWSDGAVTISQFSTAVILEYPLSRVMAVSLHAGESNTGGDVTDLNGFTDTQVSLSYRVEPANILLTIGVNAPTGKRSFSSEEFETDTLMSKEVFDFRVPRYGQGLNVHPAAVWAIPLNPQLGIGIGGGFHYMGVFAPLQDYGDYDPGDEWMLSGGIEVSLDEASRLSADVSLTTYGTDKFEGMEIYQAGDKISTALGYQRYFEYDELVVVARYRTRMDGQISLGNAIVTEFNKANPDMFDLSGKFRHRLSSQFALGFLLQMRSFQETGPALSGVTLFGAAVQPEYAISQAVQVIGTAEYQRGELKTDSALTGWEIGAGLRVRF